jgi:anti-anti-sigma factor
VHEPDAPQHYDEHASIDVTLEATGRYAAIVHVRGGHDIATSRQLRDALASLEGDVLLDLTDCAFLDSSVIFVIFADSNRRTEAGHGLELLAPRENAAIRRTLEIARARDILPVHESVDAA